jgi:hypothetical protein
MEFIGTDASTAESITVYAIHMATIRAITDHLDASEDEISYRVSKPMPRTTNMQSAERVPAQGIWGRTKNESRETSIP